MDAHPRPIAVLDAIKGYFALNNPEDQDKLLQSAHRDMGHGEDRVQDDKQKTDHTPTVTTKTTEYQGLKTVVTSNPVQCAWIFQAYLRQVDAITQRIKTLTTQWRKHKDAESGHKTLNCHKTSTEVGKLRNDMIGQMSNIKEVWVDTTKDDNWLLVDNEEKQLITRILQDSTSWG